MSGSEGFKPAGRTNPLSADYEKLQREEVVKQYQKEVNDLKYKITVLKDQVASLESDLALAFSDRLKAVERKETEANRVSQEVGQAKMALDKQKQEFEAVKAVQKSDNDRELAVIHGKISRNEDLVRVLNDRQAEFEKNEKRVNDYGVRVAKLEEDLAARKIVLDGREKNIDLKREENKAEENKILDLRKSMREEEDVLSVSRSINKNQTIELDDLRRRLEVAKKESEEASEKLKTEIEQNKQIQQSAVEIAKGNKEKEQKLIDLENELRVMEKDIKQKKQDLDERETRIKDLEKGGLN